MKPRLSRPQTAAMERGYSARTGSAQNARNVLFENPRRPTSAVAAAMTQKFRIRSAAWHYQVMQSPWFHVQAGSICQRQIDEPCPCHFINMLISDLMGCDVQLCTCTRKLIGAPQMHATLPQAMGDDVRLRLAGNAC
jgi:hypothetical protein